MAVFAFAIAAYLAVAKLVTRISKKAFELLPYSEKLTVFFTPFVNVFGEIAAHRPNENCNLYYGDDNRVNETIDNAKNKKYNYKCKVKLVCAISAIHKSAQGIKKLTKHF